MSSALGKRQVQLIAIMVGAQQQNTVGAFHASSTTHSYICSQPHVIISSACTWHGVHVQLRTAVSVITAVFELAIMCKAAAVAVLAPEQAWPSRHTGVHTRGTSSPPNVGLVYM